MSNDDDDDDDGGENHLARMILFVAGIIVMIIGSSVITTYVHRQIGPAQQSMRAVCEETSALHPRVSFRVQKDLWFWDYGAGYGRNRSGGYHGRGVRYNDDGSIASTNYIECYVADIETGTPSPSAPFVMAEPEVSVAVGLGVKSPEDRLHELENIKHLLSVEEYEAKRAEILSDV